MKRMGKSTNIVQKMIERKLNFFGHIWRMPDDKLIKQVVLGIIDGKNKRGSTYLLTYLLTLRSFGP